MTDYVKNEDGSFKSEAQIVNYLITILEDEASIKMLASNFQYDPFETEESKEMSRTTGFHPKSFYRTHFGRQIRNTFGLWNKDNPFTVQDPKPNEQGIIDDPRFPDNMSDRIIDELVHYYGMMNA